MFKLNQLLIKSLYIALVMCLSGCSVLLPKHPNSNYRTDDTTELELLDCKHMEPYWDKYALAFPHTTIPQPCPTFQSTASVGATVGLMAANWVFGEIQKRIKEEAKLYTGQYTDGEVSSAFFSVLEPKTAQQPKACKESKTAKKSKACKELKVVKKSFALNYWGFKLTRKVKGEPASEIIF